MKSNHSIAKRIERRTMFVCGKFLELIEKQLPDVIERNEWECIRKSVLDVSNNIIRANIEDLENVFYLPIYMKKNGSVHMSIGMIKVLDSLEFVEHKLSISATIPASNYDLLVGITDGIGYGKVFNNISPEMISIVFNGDEAMLFSKVLQRIALNSDVLDRFEVWRKSVNI